MKKGIRAKVKEIIFIAQEAPEGGHNAKALYHSIFAEEQH